MTRTAPITDWAEPLSVNIRALVETFDAHDAGIYDTGRYKCACGWLGEESDWYPHLASKLAEAL